MSSVPAVGDSLPDLALTAPDGAAVRPSDFAGQKLVLFFYPKDDTPGCTTENKDFSALAGAFAKAGTALNPSIPTALAALITATLLPPELAMAHAVQSRFLIASRLLAPDAQVPPPPARAVLASACQCRDWDELTTRLDESRAIVAAVWAAIFGEALEI